MKLPLLSLAFLLSLAIRESTSIEYGNSAPPRHLQSLDSSADSSSPGKKFRIKSLLSSTADTEWCVEADRLSLIVLAECNDENKAQIWTFDEDGRMKTEEDPGGCVYAMEPPTPAPSENATQAITFIGTQGASLAIGNEQISLAYGICRDPDETNTFVYNLFDQTLSNNLYGFLSVEDDIPVEGLELPLIARDSCLVGQKWILQEVIPSNLIKFAGNPCHGKDGCPICTGDCDRDEDCAEGLRCAYREDSYHVRQNVPGCTFKTPNDPERFLTNDFCFKPIQLPGVVNYVGSCDPHTYLCNECEGDCKNDHDCAEGLKCFYRSAFEGVPGCSGEGGDRDVYGKNICYDPIADVAQVRWGDKCTDVKPCDMCQGNCSVDDDCRGDLRCAQRAAEIDVPGCRFKNNEQWLRNRNQHNYCFMPNVFPGNAGIVSYVGECSSSTYLCRRCEGNCNTDDDCEGDLQCRERDHFESVPGCSQAGGNFDMKGKNVCIDADWNKPQLRTCSAWHRHNCPECSSCHDDSDCRGDLRCALRNGIDDVPGCRWGRRATLRDFIHGTNYCFKPKTEPGKLNYIGECSNSKGGYLCDECEGGCKYDIDCKPGLQCMHRSAFEKVPGCSEPEGKRDMYGKGICYNPTFIESTTSTGTCNV